MNPLIVIAISQLFFTTSDLIGRSNMRQSGFHIQTFMSFWFVLYIVLRSVATMGQLYVFATTEVGRTMALFGAFSIVLVNAAGFLFLGEVLPTNAYIGIMFAIAAILIISFAK